MAELRAGVAGAGAFGGHHARKYATLPGVRLSAVYDPHHPDRARTLAEPLGGEAVDDLARFLARIDILTVATPAVTHGEIARAALDAGKPVYVEKPLAVSVEEGQRLVDAAARRGVVLACGHQERAVLEAIGLFAVAERPLRVRAVRGGPRSGRNEDVSCVLDMMVHDLDLLLALGAGGALAVEAEGDADRVEAEVTLDSGLTAEFMTWRGGGEPRRAMTLTYPDGEVTIDFLAARLVNGTGLALDVDYTRTASARDPLGVSVGRFIAAVRGEADSPLATGLDGLRALDLALAVEQAAGL